MQLCCHAAAELNKHAYILWVKVASNTAMLPCSCGTWQTCIYYGPKQQAMRLCCHAAVELNKHTYIFIIMGQSGKHTAKNRLLIIRILVLKFSNLILKMNHTSNSKTALIKNTTFVCSFARDLNLDKSFNMILSIMSYLLALHV